MATAPSRAQSLPETRGGSADLVVRAGCLSGVGAAIKVAVHTWLRGTLVGISAAMHVSRDARRPQVRASRSSFMGRRTLAFLGIVGTGIA